MTILIVGGLLIIGVAALVALFLVARSEPAVRNTENATITPQRAVLASQEVPTPQTTASPSRPESATTDRSPALTSRDMEEGSLQDQPLSIPTPGERVTFPLQNGQLREFIAEMYALQQQAQEMEHRLSVLTGITEHLEQANHASIASNELATRDAG